MLRVIGMGPGDIKYVTPAAVEKIQASCKVLAFGRISESAEKIKRPIIKIGKVHEILEHMRGEEDIAVLASGDPCFYGILAYLQKHKITVDEVVPGLSSFQYMMARLKKSWHHAQLVSFHGREDRLERISQNRLSVVLTDHQNTPQVLSEMLYQKGVRGKIYAGFNLSYPDEHIIVKNIGGPISGHSALAVVVIENEMA
ncbi:MAG: precorrin-6y C5,15-methyltransferase (decarboxylating) subunit CbiE [Firmicutes bacterium]|nr:precorrin-6y C5,15-methyltransferase (decarboxylating) subunit CbiE [Bacillota bacterium]